LSTIPHLARTTGEDFVDGVIDDLIDEMVQPARGHIPDIHRRPPADSLETLENLNIFGAIFIMPVGGRLGLFDDQFFGLLRGHSVVFLLV